MYSANYCDKCNLRPCLVEEMLEDICYICGSLSIEICSMRCKRLNAYNKFVRIVYGILGKGIRVEIPIYCVKAIQENFPKESDAEVEYSDFRLSAGN